MHDDDTVGELADASELEFALLKHGWAIIDSISARCGCGASSLDSESDASKKFSEDEI